MISWRKNSSSALAHEAEGEWRTSKTESWFDPRQPEGLFAPLAHSVARLFADVDRNRVRKRGQCVLHLHDTSMVFDEVRRLLERCGEVAAGTVLVLVESGWTIIMPLPVGMMR